MTEIIETMSGFSVTNINDNTLDLFARKLTLNSVSLLGQIFIGNKFRAEFFNFRKTELQNLSKIIEGHDDAYCFLCTEPK